MATNDVDLTSPDLVMPKYTAQEKQYIAECTAMWRKGLVSDGEMIMFVGETAFESIKAGS